MYYWHLMYGNQGDIHTPSNAPGSSSTRNGLSRNSGDSEVEKGDWDESTGVYGSNMSQLQEEKQDFLVPGHCYELPNLSQPSEASNSIVYFRQCQQTLVRYSIENLSKTK